MLVWCTKRSLEPSSGVMKPKPFSSLNHFTVPVGICPPPSLAGPRAGLIAAQPNTIVWRVRGIAGGVARRPARNTGGVLASHRSRVVVATAAALALADASIVTLALPQLLIELDASVE